MVGLKGVEYMDSLQDKKRLKEGSDSITFTDELDRIYLQTPDVLEVSAAPVLCCCSALVVCALLLTGESIIACPSVMTELPVEASCRMTMGGANLVSSIVRGG